MSEAITDMGLRYAVNIKQIRRWRVRCCAICGDGLYYRFPAGDGKVLYDPRCTCSPAGTEPVERTFTDLANVFMQQREEVRQRMWRDFLASTGTR